jgi:hypothetical protein
MHGSGIRGHDTVSNAVAGTLPGEKRVSGFEFRG